MRRLGVITMTRRKKIAGVLATTVVLAAVVTAFIAGGERTPSYANPGVSIAVDANPAGNTASSLGTVDNCISVNNGDTFDLDIVITDVTRLQVWNVFVHYDPSIVNVIDRDVQMLLAANSGSDVQDGSYGDPDLSGQYDALASDVAEAEPAHENGSGVLMRLTLKATSPGVTTVMVEDEFFWSFSNPHNVQIESIANAWIAVDQPCPHDPPPMPTPSPTPYPTGTAVPTPSPQPTTTATATPTGTPTPVPGTVFLVSGWNDACYVGEEKSVEAAFAGVLDHVLAVYHLRPDQGFDRWFPGRPDVSTITTLPPYAQLFILTSQGDTWTQTQSGSLPTQVALGLGWNSVCYTGPAKDVAAATQSIAGNFSVIYTLTSDQTWRRYIPGRPEVSNLDELFPSISVLMLVTTPDPIQWVFDP